MGMTEHSRKMFLNILVTLTLAVCELAGQDLHLQEPITNPPPNYRCVPMQDVDICSNIHIEYVNGSLPNYRNQDDLAVVNNELENFIPLIRRQCSNAIVHLLCSIYVPFCTNNDPQHAIRRVPPCRSLCEHVRAGCEDDLIEFNLDWPPHLDCEQYPVLDNTTLCFGPEDIDALTIPDIPGVTLLNVTDPTPTDPPPIYECVPIQDINICTNIGYLNGSFPNYRDQYNHADVNAELEIFLPLIHRQCSNAIVHLLCSVYAPFCSIHDPQHAIRLVPPCRSFCEYVRAGCEDDLLELNLDWPSHLDCEQYPVIGDNTVCFGPANPNALTIPPIDITDPPTPPDLPVKQECDGLSTSESLNSLTIERFRSEGGCNIITSGGLYIGDTDADNTPTEQQLQLLESITEIRGPLRIQGWSRTSFPYLKNLQYIGSENGTKIEISTGIGKFPVVLVLASNEHLRSIDLSSLRGIRGAGYVIGNNPELCYTGDLSRYLLDPSHHPVNLPPLRKDFNECALEGYVCHEQCSSTSECWGPRDTQCDSCRSYIYQRQCVPDCSAVDLPANSSGLFQNPTSRVCEECDQQCLGGCTNGTGPEHCNACAKLVNQSNYCVESCDPGSYASEQGVCIQCDSLCRHCTGPSNYNCTECKNTSLEFEVLAEATEHWPSLLLCCGGGERAANGSCETQMVVATSKQSTGPDAGAIAGGVLAGLVVIIIVIIGISLGVWVYRRSSSVHQKITDSEENQYTNPVYRTTTDVQLEDPSRPPTKSHAPHGQSVSTPRAECHEIDEDVPAPHRRTSPSPASDPTSSESKVPPNDPDELAGAGKSRSPAL